MLYLRADTLTEVTIGPAVAVGDGFTPVTTLSIAAADEAEIIKHGATATTAIAGTLQAITGADGYYALDLSTTDTNTEGRLVLLINDDSLILPIRHEFMVVNANVYDALFAAAGVDLLNVQAAGMDLAVENQIRDSILPTQNAAFNNLMFQFVAASDHVTPVTGATGIAVTRSIDGGAFSAATGSVAEVGNGMYQFDASAADMNGGIITFRFTATGGSPGAPDDKLITIVTGGGV